MPLARLESPRSLGAALVALIRGKITALFLLGMLLGLNLLQVASLLLRLFSDRSFRRFNRWAANTFWTWCARTTRSFHGTEVVFSGDARLPYEEVVLIANHQSMADVQVLFLLAQRENRLGDMKWFVKDVVKFVPGPGWGMTFLDCIFVKRDWAADKEYVERAFRRIIDARIPVWLVSFVEGTRLTPAKLAQARRYAEERHLPVPSHTLVPRTKGFVASVTALRQHIGAVYDVTIGYVGGQPSLWQWAMGLMEKVHIDVRRFPVDELPLDPERLSDWVRDRFREKDQRLDRFYREGSFDPRPEAG